nr:MAG TPA: polyVal ADP-Ribosyltransferase [Bacteriophage sp.]
MTNNDLAVELLQQRKKKREDPQSAATQTSTQSMSGQAALAQELLSQRIQARKEREATQPTVSLPSQRIDPAKERQESKGKFNGWKYFGNLGKTLLTGVASLAQTGAMAEDVVTSAVDTIFKGANTKGSGLFNALYHGRPDWKFLGENGLVGIEQEKNYLDQEREAEIAKINDSNIAGKVAKKAASYGGDIAYGVGYAIPMAATAGVAAAPIVNGVATSTEALANLGASVVESSGVLNALGKGFRDTLRSKDYWMAFTSEVGADYQEALSDGASTGEAMNYAIATSLLNSVIEVGGGIQKVPENFSVKNLLRSAAEEGMEEIWQGPVGRTMQNVVYGANNPIVSTTDDRAIFNPVTSAQEFAGGFTVGGILSGAQMAAGKAANSIYSKQVEKQSQRYEQAQARVKELSGVKGTYQTGENGKTTVGGNESAIKSVVKGGQIEMANGEVVSPDKVKFADRNTADLYEGAISRAANAGAANVFIDSYTGGDVSRYLLGMQEAYEDGRAGVVTEKRGTFADDLTDAQRTAAWNQGAADGLQSFRSDTGLGENGSDAWTQVQQNQAVRSNPRLRTGFTSMYQAGLSGKALTDVKSDAAKYIPPSVQTAAYQAGLADAASSLAREKAGVKLVTRSDEAGLADNDYSRNLANKDAGTARVLGALASDMGVRIEIVPQVQGGAANGKYVNKTNTIQLAADADNPLAFVAAHEVTHRMQDAAPTEYHAYRDAVMEYRANELGDDTSAHMVERYRDASREAGVTLTQEEAMDEIAADFTAEMLNDADLFERFAAKNRTAAKTLLDRLKEFISKVKNLVASKRNKAAQEAYGKNFAELQKIADLWQTAYDKAAETVRESTNAVTANADESAKLQIRRKYWKPKLRSDEWTLLNKKLDEEIGSSEQYLDEATKWLYANEKGVQVFALYGIGDGTEATPLYAVGGKQAAAYNAAVIEYIERREKYDGNGGSADSWVELLRSKKGRRRRNISQAKGSAGVAGTVYGLHGGSQNGDVRGTSGRSTQDQRGVKEKFSLRDSTGRELTAAQQDYFKDSKVRDAAGRLKVMYRGGSGDFTVFDRRKSKYSNLYGRGFYFTDSESHAKQYGNARAFYLNITNPVSTTETSITRAQFRKFLKAVAGNEDDFSFENYGYGATVDSVLKSTYGKSDFYMLYDVSQTAIGDMVQAVELFNEVNGTNYDGLILDTETVAFRSNQIKNIDNKTPSSDPDIRFQLKSQTQIESEMRDIKKERDRLKTRVQSLERQVARWKAETKPSMPSFREGDLKKLGNRLINDFDSSTKYREIKTDMENLGKALLSQDVPDTELHAYAEYVAEKIIQNSRVLEEGGEDLLEIQKHLKSVKLAYTDDGSIPDFSEWKKTRRDIKFAKDGGLPVDVAYHELTEMFGGGYFPASITNLADQLTRMGEVLEDIDSIWSNPYDEYHDIAVTALGNSLIESMISDDVRQTRPTYADRKEQEIAHLKDLLSKTRAGRDEKIKQMRTAYAERTKAGAERRKAREIRARISKHAGTLSQKLLHPTDKQHIPEQLRTPVAALLRSINTESTRSYDENGRLRSWNNGTPTQRTQDAIRLREAYDSILSNDPNFVIDPALFGGDGTSGFIDQLVQLGNQRIDEMNTAQLNVIWKAIKGIETTITSYDKALSSGKYMFISQWANDLRSGVSSRKRANKKAVLSLYDPRTFFNAYGDAGLDVFRALRNAEDTQNRRVAEVAKLTEKFMSREVYKQRNERHTFTTEAGQTITLTNDQIMNLYNLANRGKHSMQHLSVGGVIQPYIKRDGKLPAIERGTKSIPITANDVAQITGVLTDEQIKVAKGLQKIASTMLAKWGNEASMAVYGYNKFTEEHYWPIKSAREAIVQNAERGENMPREIRNMGSAKALNENASNTLDLGGVFDVFTKNASDMITYSTMLEPMEDINRLFNYRYRDSAGNLTGKNVKNVLTDVYGEQALKYWRNLMSDVQNGIAHDDEPITRMIEKFVGRTKAASVGMNARVVLQQPTAFFRAAAILDPSDMAKGLVKAPTKGNGWKKAKQYAGIAAIKDSSGFDQAGQYTIMKGILNGADQTFMDKLSDASGAAAAKADAVTWGKIWNACEYTVQKEGRYEVGSEDFYTRTAEVFSDVIDQSQVVDGILQRTQIMRSGNGLTKQATAFMGEPMKSLNMLLRAYDAWRYETNPSKKSAALKQFARTSIALLVTDGVNALVQSLVDAARKDDKDKDYWGRYFEVLTGVTGEDDTVVSVLLGSNLWDNIDPVGRIPFAKDIKSMLQGYTVSRMDADAVSDFIAAAQLFTKATQGDGQKTTLYAFKQLLVTGSKIFGISVGNIGRDTWAVARSIAQETGSYWAMYQMEQMIFRVAPDAKNSSRYYSILYHALQDDKAAYDRIYADLISKGYTDKQIKTGMKNAIKNAGGSDMLSQLEDVGFSREDAETVIKQQEFKQSYGFSYDDLADEYADGNISRREVIRALQNVGGLSAEDAELKATAYDWKNAGVSDATNAIVKAYQSYGSDAGFDKKSFAEAYKDLNAVKGEDTDGDGKIEKKQFVLEAINKMNISTAQKDALYRMKGYGEKQLADAPWH